MNHPHHLLPAVLLATLPAAAWAETGLEEIIVPIGITGVVFGFTAVIVAVVAYARHRAQQLRHETIRLALEKGQPLPPDLLDPASLPDGRPGHHSPERDLRRGLVLVALGIGVCLYVGLARFPGTGHNWSVGLIPGLIGVAYLVAWAVGRRPNAPPPGR